MPQSEVRRFKSGIPDHVICPYCLEEFPLWNIRFTGPSGDSRTAKASAKDILLHRAPRFALDSRGESLREKQCPHCLHLLPYTAGDQVDIIIGMVGAKYSGKSHYVATLVQRLQNEVGRDFDAALIHVDQATSDRYRDEFYGPLYEQQVQLPVTQTAPQPPLLYSFSVAGSIFGRGQPNRSVTLVFYDTSGENFAHESAIRDFTKYVARASGLIFLIDPLQIKTVRELVGESAPLPNIHHEGEPQEILGRVVKELTVNGLVTPDRKTTIPVAIALTKCDVLRDLDLINRNSLFNRDRFHSRTYNMDIHNDINGMFSAVMQKWSLSSYTIIDHFFREYALFGVSATGCAADGAGRFPFISPWRVEDPLLWLLYRLNIIPGNET